MSKAFRNDQLDRLILRLERIALENDDTFRYWIDASPTRSGTIEYTFVCEESADGHELLTGMGYSIEAAAADAALNVDSACKDWGYLAIL